MIDVSQKAHRPCPPRCCVLNSGRARLVREPSAERRKEKMPSVKANHPWSRHSAHGTASPAQWTLAVTKMVGVVSRSLTRSIPLPQDEVDTIGEVLTVLSEKCQRLGCVQPAVPRPAIGFFLIVSHVGYSSRIQWPNHLATSEQAAHPDTLSTHQHRSGMASSARSFPRKARK